MKDEKIKGLFRQLEICTKQIEKEEKFLVELIEERIRIKNEMREMMGGESDGIYENSADAGE